LEQDVQSAAETVQFKQAAEHCWQVQPLANVLGGQDDRHSEPER